MRTRRLAPLLAGLAAVAVAAAAALPAQPASAAHSWSGYHWQRSANGFTLQLGDMVNSKWDQYLIKASREWTASATDFDTQIVPGTATVSRCDGPEARIEVCNASYGRNGWLGIAAVYTFVGDPHVRRATVKLNDTYFNKGSYNTVAWRSHVMCQEIGHAFGLAHQDEDHSNTNVGSCMDYTNTPAAGGQGLSNEQPNDHDGTMLSDVALYGHLDGATYIASLVAATSTSTISQSVGAEQSSWGSAVSQDASGRDDTFVRVRDGVQIATHVVWAMDELAHDHLQHQH